MAVKLIFTLFIFTVCIQLYIKIKSKEDSFVLMISTALITTIIGNIILPSNIPLFDIMNNENETINENDLYMSEEISKRNEIEERKKKIEATKSSIKENDIETSSFYKAQIEYDSNKQLNENSNSDWSMQYEELYEEYIKQELDELNQQISAEIKESDIKLD